MTDLEAAELVLIAVVLLALFLVGREGRT